jgi:ribonuclease P protein component
LNLDQEKTELNTLLQWGDAKFSDSERLLKGHEFRHMRNNGRSVIGKYMVLSFAKAPDDKRRIGVIVSKKFDKKAVQRNRAYRVIREAYRLIKSRVKQDVWIVVIARKHLHSRNTFEVQQELLSLLNRENLVEVSKDDT